MNMICVKCNKEYYCKRNGVTIRFKNTHTYKQADLFQCPECGHKIVSGFSQKYNKQAFGPIVAEIGE